jgi:hypothetical protein
MVLIGGEFNMSYKPYNINNKVILTDIRSSGTNGGQMTASTWNVRILNTLENAQDWIAQDTESGAKTIGTDGDVSKFILQPGIYKINALFECSCGVLNSKLKLYNTTDASDERLGLSIFGLAAAGHVNNGRLKGIITITSAKTFEFQHYANTTIATNGLGRAVGLGDEIYAMVEIEKIG